MSELVITQDQIDLLRQIHGGAAVVEVAPGIFEVGGTIRARLVGSEIAEKALSLTCAPYHGSLDFPDNLIGECARCGAALQYRPEAPVRPPKLCYKCFNMGPGH